MFPAEPLTISELTSRIKGILEESFFNIEVEGEISNFRPSSSGHLYFTLKDDSSAISAVMFRGKAKNLGFIPKNGDLVKVSGSVSVYEARGTYQIIVETMEPSGEGEILKMLEARKKILAAEGLFDESRKRKPKRYPERVAVITSPTGAAIRDILQVLSRRNPAVSIVILPAPVQGAEAAGMLKYCLETANKFKMAETIIIGRGGGSLEDLLPFSDEALVRAVAASEIPVISAVGHEIDWSLCDYAADVRAPTPSAAAELASAPLSEIESLLGEYRRSIISEIERRIENARNKTAIFSAESMEMRFRHISQPIMLRFDTTKEEMIQAVKEKVSGLRHTLSIQKEKIKSADPNSILSRGFSIVKNTGTGKIVTNASMVKTGDNLTIMPAVGEISAQVLSSKTNTDKLKEA